MMGKLIVRQYAVATMLTYILTTIGFKIALGLFYLRIVVKPWQRNIVYAVLAISTTWGFVYFFVTLFGCGNPSQYLEHAMEMKCLSWETNMALIIVAGLVNTLSEWIFALLLLIALGESLMPKPAKISAGCLLLLGTMGSFCSVIRLAYVHEADPKNGNIGAKFTMWSMAECGICIMAAALAATRPLFRCCMERARAYTPTLTSRRNGTIKSTVRHDRVGAHQLSDRSSQDNINNHNMKQSREFEPWGYNRSTYTTVVGNSKAIEQLGLAR